jgi:GT2 family glycosyltransferase
MELSIICVNWNSVDYLRDCIASIYEYTRGISFEIIVVDNASPDGGVECLKDQFPEITIIKSQKNLGFAGANNLGFRHSAGSYVLFLNPDTKLIAPSLSVMLESIKSLHDAGIVGCKLLNTDLSVQLTSVQTLPTIVNQVLDIEFLQLRWPHCRLWDISPLFSTDTNPIKVEVISGACMLLKKEVFEQVGMFSEDYFMYAEDLDLNYKVQRAGFTNYYVGGTSIIHHAGGSSSRQKVNHWATVMKYRALLRYIRKTHGPFYALIFRVAMTIAAVARLFIIAVISIFGNALGKRETRHSVFAKWSTILRTLLTPSSVNG